MSQHLERTTCTTCGHHISRVTEVGVWLDDSPRPERNRCKHTPADPAVQPATTKEGHGIETRIHLNPSDPPPALHEGQRVRIAGGPISGEYVVDAVDGTTISLSPTSA